MMSDHILPRLRDDIGVSVYSQDNESRILLQDPMGVAEGPILLHMEMVDVLEACDGSTTYIELALAAGIDVDGPEMLHVRTFLARLSAMGYMDDAAYAALEAKQTAEFGSLDVRDPVYAGSSYPEDAEALRSMLTDMLGPQGSYQDPPSTARGALIPHLDFRVAAHVYGPCFAPVRGTDADLFVLIGTSHYWWQHPFILTEKHFRTPLGIVQTDRELVARFRDALADLDPSLAAPVDIAHRPEHALEYHVLGIQHLMPHRPIRILPVLITSSWLSDADVMGAMLVRSAMDELRRLVDESGARAFWLVSGDLAHVGRKFGDDVDAASMEDDVRQHDAELMRHLAAADAAAWLQTIQSGEDRFRVCGQAPVYAALQAFRPKVGTVTAYDIWHETETASAVSVCGISWT
ncbi:MAG: AmmeMemoRadiSam system protein B [Candidatus Kapabacteria bacterium]|nr:AmmeMemoRadiSam system protein B [Candidatus Kapabacteria bacterium]